MESLTWNILDLLRQPHITQFDRTNLLEFSRRRGFEISDTQHPLEAAHQAAFELIDSYNLV